MMNEKDWNDLMLSHELAYLRGDLATSSPESYTIEEMKEICNDMMVTSKAVLDAMREDFQELPPHAPARMLDLLQKVDPGNFEWRKSLLLDSVPSSTAELNS